MDKSNRIPDNARKMAHFSHTEWINPIEGALSAGKKGN